MTEPFGRQPQPVHVMLAGEPEDVATYRFRIARYIECTHGDHVVESPACKGLLTIYPRAVND